MTLWHKELRQISKIYVNERKKFAYYCTQLGKLQDALAEFLLFCGPYYPLLTKKFLGNSKGAKATNFMLKFAHLMFSIVKLSYFLLLNSPHTKLVDSAISSTCSTFISLSYHIKHYIVVYCFYFRNCNKLNYKSSHNNT